MSDQQREFSPGEPPRVSETAIVIAELIPHMSPETVEDLGRLIQRRLTMLDTRAERYARLGLLIDIVSERTGEVPSVARYRELRAVREPAGERWPSDTALSTAYGGWVNAVRVAMELVWNGASVKTPRSTHHQKISAPYSGEEAVAAFLVCCEALGCWPTEYEYEDWRVLSRELARRAGMPEPRYPATKTWKRLYGGKWHHFEAAVRRQLVRAQS
ncbi:MAG TPA: hypothetical protein VHV75_10280 [Solirubrobacteraceae bacterium]|nr:hypothetical protein [Solirubrobacteraceae bacterium]